MTITFEVLGKPDSDNALWVRIDSGQSITRLLFDCGDGCLDELSFSEIQATDHLFFSHLHMDHIGGFDSYFRCTFNRDTKPNHIWGPPETSTVLQHRFQGFWWNLHADQTGTWHVHDVHANRIETSRYEIQEAFATRHTEAPTGRNQPLIDHPDFTVEALLLEHNGPCLGYLVRETASINVDMQQLAAMGLRPGPWIKDLKSDSPILEIVIEGETYDLTELRTKLLVETPGDSIAYLTDFLLDEPTFTRLESWLANCNTVICEAQYSHADLELAQRNCHTTTKLVSEMAARSGINQLILFHLSSRYTPQQWTEMLQEARETFPATNFPDNWEIGG